MWAVLPAKDFRHAKERLSPALSPAERQALFAAMLEDVLAAATAAVKGAAGLDGVLVLTREDKAAALAKRYGARVESEPANEGQSPAVARAAALLQSEGVNGVVTLPGDTPNLTPDEIAHLLAVHAAAAAPALTIVPSHDGRGSNCLCVSPPDLIPFHFGHNSFKPHLAEAEARGVTPAIVEDLPGIALDIDTPADLAKLLETDADTRARAYLDASGITERFSAEARRPGAA
jgi:2-phospho-L-lactate guanylyltransferase